MRNAASRDNGCDLHGTMQLRLAAKICPNGGRDARFLHTLHSSKAFPASSMREEHAALQARFLLHCGIVSTLSSMTPDGLEALRGVLIRQECIMPVSAVHPRTAHFQMRGANRPEFTKLFSGLIVFIRVLPEVFIEAKEMMREAERRYPFVSFDS